MTTRPPSRSPWPTGVSKTLGPEQRSERARNAALARTTPEHHIHALARQTLTAEQRAQLAELITGEVEDGVA
jgi:hypothetical protein